MNILILVQIFETPSDTGSDRHYYFAKKISDSGHNVSVITANVDYKKAERRYKDFDKTFEREVDRVTIKYVPVYTKFRGSFFKRILFFLTYFTSSLREILKGDNFDVVYAVSTPLTVGVLGVIASKLRRKPLIFEVTDVWPDAAVHAGVVKNRILIAFAHLIEMLCYRSAKKIICLTRGIQSNIQRKGIDPLKTILIPNGVDFDLFRSIDDEEAGLIKKEFHVDNKFVVMYLGAHGAYNSLDTILQAADILQDIHSIHFVFVGDGDEKSKLMNFVASHNLTNVSFLGTVSRDKSIQILSMADAFLLPNRKGHFFHGNLPNKLFDFLGSSRPVIVAGFGESADLVSDAAAGLVVEAEDPESFAAAVYQCFQMSDHERRLMGQRGRSHVENSFNRRIHASNLLSIFNEL